MERWNRQRVLTLGALNRAMGTLEPSHATYFQNPRPTSPEEPQNYLRPTLSNGPSLIDHSMSLGALGRAVAQVVPGDELGPPANPSSSGTMETRIDLRRYMMPTWFDMYVRPLAAGAAAYHGYGRNKSYGWAIMWAVAGGFFPLITNGIALAQGYGKPR